MSNMIAQPEGSTDADYVRVRFTETGRLYTYYCPGQSVGSWVEVITPNGAPKTFRVAELGRAGYTGNVKTAKPTTPPEDAPEEKKGFGL